MIAAVGYDPEHWVLYAEFFNGGKIYAYENVQPATFKKLLKSGSVGRFMRDEIIDFYPYFPVNRRHFRW